MLHTSKIVNFRPKQSALIYISLNDYFELGKYLYSSGYIHTYIDKYRNLYRIHEDGSVIYPPSPFVINVYGLSLKYLAKNIRYAKTYGTAHLGINLNLLNNTLIKHNVIAHGNSLMTFEEYAINLLLNKPKFHLLPHSFPVKDAHAVHISTENENLLAYCPSAEYLLENRFVKIKPGRYLKKYFPELSDDEIRLYAATINGNTHLTFHKTFDEMYKIYREMKKNEVVSSCMAGDDWDHILDNHPLQVYHNSDVELAVLRDINNDPIARALYNKNTKEYPMIYGYWEKMNVALTNAGYTHGSLNGAVINKILTSNDTKLVMPYIDGHRKLDRSFNQSTSINVYDTYCEITDNGKFNCAETEGYIQIITTKCCNCCGAEYNEEEPFTYVGRSETSLVCEECLNESYIEIVYTINEGTYFEHNTYPHYSFIPTEDGCYNFATVEIANHFNYYKCYHTGGWYHLDDLEFIEGLDDYVHKDFADEYLISPNNNREQYELSA